MRGPGRLLRGLTPAQLCDDVLGAVRPVERRSEVPAGDRVGEALKSADRALRRLGK